MPEKTTTLPVDTPHPLVKKVIAGKPPIAELIGFDLEDIGDGRAVFSLQAGSQHANPVGTLHGGVLCDLADAAMGIAFATTLALDESFTTMSLNINFFPSGVAGWLASKRIASLSSSPRSSSSRSSAASFDLWIMTVALLTYWAMSLEER